MNEHRPQEPADPVERADARRAKEQGGDVKVTLVPKGKDHPEQGPYEPVNDKVVPDTDADAPPKGKNDLGA